MKISLELNPWELGRTLNPALNHHVEHNRPVSVLFSLGNADILLTGNSLSVS